jgi:hypothetical protein
MTAGGARRLRRRVESLRVRLDALSNLRRVVDLPVAYDIAPRQWAAIEPELALLGLRLKRRLNATAQRLLSRQHELAALRELNAAIGSIELEMSKAFVLFDTYMDVLTQRHVPELGSLLRGCDVLAWHGLRKDHPALEIIEPPLVYCDRGVGASTMREGIHFPGKGRNPVPLIQIPYSRLKEKPNLTSILHEAGHEAMVRLGLVKAMPESLRAALTEASASTTVRDLYSLWTSEIGPDFWTFCACGMAETATLKEIIALPPRYVLQIAAPDPHPPPLLRVLLSFEWCRQLWGRGLWDDWQREWLDFYPVQLRPAETREMLGQCQRYIPVVASALLRTRYKVLGNRTVPSLFDMSQIDPRAVSQAVAEFPRGLGRLSPPAQIGVFRMLKENESVNEEQLDGLMTKWLLLLAKNAALKQ